MATSTIDASSKATSHWPYVTSDNDVGNVIPFLNSGVFQILKIVYVSSSSYFSTKIIPDVFNRIHIRCPLQTGSPMTCCKHLFHTGPPWPNGLPGLPEAAQHCLFADTVLPCRTCRRLKTTSKVRQRNEPVRSRVVTLGLPGLSAICHPPVC